MKAWRLNEAAGFESQRLARDGLDLLCQRFWMAHQHGRALQRLIWTRRDVAAAAVVSNQAAESLRARLGSQNDRTVHDGDIVRSVRQPFDASAHRKADLHAIAVMPRALDAGVGRRL